MSTYASGTFDFLCANLTRFCLVSTNLTLCFRHTRPPLCAFAIRHCEPLRGQDINCTTSRSDIRLHTFSTGAAPLCHTPSCRPLGSMNFRSFAAVNGARIGRRRTGVYRLSTRAPPPAVEDHWQPQSFGKKRLPSAECLAFALRARRGSLPSSRRSSARPPRSRFARSPFPLRKRTGFTVIAALRKAQGTGMQTGARSVDAVIEVIGKRDTRATEATCSGSTPNRPARPAA